MKGSAFKEWILSVLVYTGTMLLPVFKLMLGVGVLVVSDFITGILAAKSKGEEITSKKMRNTVMKGAGYMISLIAAFTVQKVASIDLPVEKIVAGVIAFVELKSIDENIYVLTGKSLFNQILKNRDSKE